MTTTVAALRVSLSADTTKLRKGLAAARAQMAKLGAAVAGVAASFGAIVNSGLSGADAIAKLADRTGASVESLSALEYQARLSDASLSDLEDAFNDLNRNIDEARNSTSNQARALARLGLDYRRLQQLRPEQQFAVISDALNKVTRESVRAKLGNDLFGGSYRRLLPLIKGGSEGMKRAAREAGNLGLILNSEAANGAVAANDSIARLRASFSGLSRSLAIEFAPSITKVVEWLSESIPKAVAVAKAAVVTIATIVASVSSSVSNFLDSQKRAADFKRLFFRLGKANEEGIAAGTASLEKSLGTPSETRERVNAATAGFSLLDRPNIAKGDNGSFGGLGAPAELVSPLEGIERQAQETNRLLRSGIPAVAQ